MPDIRTVEQHKFLIFRQQHIQIGLAVAQGVNRPVERIGFLLRLSGTRRENQRHNCCYNAIFNIFYIKEIDIAVPNRLSDKNKLVAVDFPIFATTRRSSP